MLGSRYKIGLIWILRTFCFPFESKFLVTFIALSLDTERLFSELNVVDMLQLLNEGQIRVTLGLRRLVSRDIVVRLSGGVFTALSLVVLHPFTAATAVKIEYQRRNSGKASHPRQSSGGPVCIA